MKRPGSAIVLLLLSAGLSAACVMPDQLQEIQQDVADLKQQMSRIEREQLETQDQVQNLSSHSRERPEAGIDRAEIADLTLRIDRVTRDLATSDQRVQDLQQRMDRFSQDLDQTRVLARSAVFPELARDGEEPVLTDPQLLLPGTLDPSATATAPAATTAAAAAAGSSARPDPEALYNTAYADFSKGNFALAISGFEEYQQRFPDSALSDNALYWIGECHFSQGNYPSAIDAFDRLLDRYPRSDKAAAADLKKALAFMEQNQVGQAIVQLRYVVSSYPRSDEARIARDKLSGLGATPE